MTTLAVVVLLCAGVALAEGAVLEALGLLAAAVVLLALAHRGVGSRPYPFTVTWRSGRWRS